MGGGTVCTIAQIKRKGDGVQKVAITCTDDVAGIKKDSHLFDGDLIVYSPFFIFSTKPTWPPINHLL